MRPGCRSVPPSRIAFALNDMAGEVKRLSPVPDAVLIEVHLDPATFLIVVGELEYRMGAALQREKHPTRRMMGETVRFQGMRIVCLLPGG